MTFRLKLYHDVFDASANHISPLAPNLSFFCGVMAFFLTSPKRQIPLTSFFYFLFGAKRRACCSLSIKCSPKISTSNSSIYSSDEHIVPPRTAGWTSSYHFCISDFLALFWGGGVAATNHQSFLIRPHLTGSFFGTVAVLLKLSLIHI